MTNENDRDRGVLSSSDRQFLRSPEQFSRQATHQRENAIRERGYNSLLDGSVLLEHTTPDQRREIFDAWKDFAEPVSDPSDEDRPDHFADPAESRGKMIEQARAESGVRSWLAFLYLGTSESGGYDFEAVLRRAIERAEESRGRIVTDLDFQVDTRERRSLDELKSRFQRRARLTTAEIQRLRAADEITDEQLVAYYDDLGGDTRP
jgi:hypothetical protein